MAKLLIDFIEAVDKISHKIIKGTNGYYLPKITSDHLNFEIQHRGITGETSPDSTLNIAIKRSQSHLLGEQDKEEGFWAGVLEGDVKDSVVRQAGTIVPHSASQDECR